MSDHPGAPATLLCARRLVRTGVIIAIALTVTWGCVSLLSGTTAPAALVVFLAWA